jgi:hypothetical protein
LLSKKKDGSSPKKVTETKKTVDTKKSPEPSAEKKLEKGNAEVPTKRNPTILKKSSQSEVSSINPPDTSGQKIVVDKSELLSQSKALAPFSLEGELAKVKILIPLSELLSKDVYRS